MIENMSGLEPVGVAVLLKPYAPERKAATIELPPSVQKAVDVNNYKATVIAVGPLAWNEEVDKAGNVVPRATPGDRVLVTNLAGTMVLGPADGQQYKMVNDRDIFARIVKES